MMRDFEKIEIILNDKSIQLMQWLDEAIKSYALEGAPNCKKVLPITLNWASFTSKKMILPKCAIQLDSASHDLYWDYIHTLVSAMGKVGYEAPIVEKTILNDHFVITFHLLTRLVALVCAED
ncbi:MAG: hypothetical protein SFW66_04650, partial [Gammaproteobacteria bacterium]|nr:hypothetical protein [Gammaproteobacteria bacterium]